MSNEEVRAESKYSDASFKGILREVVPERCAEIDKLLARHGVTIRADEISQRPRFFVDLDTHEITVSTSSMQRIYGHAYAYLSLYQVIEAAQDENPQIREVAIADERFATAMAVLKWAMRTDAITGHSNGETGLCLQHYPADVPRPFDPNNDDPTHRVAVDVALMTLGLILLHEVAHLELGHNLTRGPDSLAQEYEADAWAAAFFLEKCDEYAKAHGHKLTEARGKRLLSLVISELWALHFEVHLGVKTSDTHPPTYDRLPNVLDRHMHAEEWSDLAWAMAATVLRLHYQARYDTPDIEMTPGDYREDYQYYADLLSKKPRLDF